MKRPLIITALCALLLVSIGTTTVMANQAGNSPIYTFRVAAADGAGSGILTINAQKHTFVFNGKGFEPDKALHLQYTVAGMPGTHQFASVAVTHAGTVHLKGTWARSLAELPAVPVFTVSTTTSTLNAVLTSPAAFVAGEGLYRPVYTLNWWLDGSTSTGDIVKYTLEFIPGPGDEPVVQIYSGTDPHFAGTASPFRHTYYPTYNYVAVLAVYDSAGNSDTTALIFVY